MRDFTQRVVGSGYAVVLALAALLLGTSLALGRWSSEDWTPSNPCCCACAPPVRKDVVIVGIDEATLQQFAEPFALWHGHIGTFLRGMALAKASVVGLDVVLPSRSSIALPGSDARSCWRPGGGAPLVPVVLGTSADDTGQPPPIYAPSRHPGGRGRHRFAVAGARRRPRSAPLQRKPGCGRPADTLAGR
ncbi:hypothetical protein [Candidatus Aalborgicola defluviihabitans]|uniref:hypothetical protein n=1 Tax=Candidatus Aalborgicola defluviihabitans TaxID=3386187 RepID=UPI001D44EA89|nr:hypothetical protein [Burkholderiales bacterium]